MREAIFTIGHSNHTIEHFVGLLKQHNINALCDVRSKPYSRINPQFNREEVKQSLRECGIIYIFLGKELGARTDDPSCYDDGKVKFNLLAQTDLFRQGVRRIQEGMKKYRIALMCAEKDPLECHRAILIARHLEALNLAVQHIHGNGKLESQAEALNRLIYHLGLHERHMFQSCDDVLADAYKIQGERIAYSRNRTFGTGVNTIRSAMG